MTDNRLRKLFTVLYRYARRTLTTYLTDPNQVGRYEAARLVLIKPYQCSFSIFSTGGKRWFNLFYVPCEGVEGQLLAEAARGVAGAMAERGFDAKAQAYGPRSGNDD